MKKIVTIFFILLIIIIYIMAISNNKQKITYLTTSFTTENTTIVTQNKGIIENIEKYEIKCVDFIYELNMGMILVDKYGNKAIQLREGCQPKTIYFNYFNIYDIIESDGFIYVLFSHSLNKSKILKYDSAFNFIGESPELIGVPRNIVAKNDYLYLLSNDYSDEIRKVVLYKISCKTLSTKNKIFIDSLTFAFYLGDNDNDNELAVYGNISEINYTLGISFLNIDLEERVTKSYDEPVLWVRDIQKYGNGFIVLNDLSIIKLNSEYDIVGVYSKENHLILDAKASEKSLYVLSNNLDKNIAIIEVLDINTFLVRNSFQLSHGLEEDHMLPSALLVVDGGK